MKEVRIDQHAGLREMFQSLFTTDHLSFNQVVQCTTAGVMEDEVIYGRLLQIRKGVGQFGSDLYLIRTPNGTLRTIENDVLKPCELECPIKEYDSETTEYRIADEWPETGFIIENPKQPEIDSPCSVIIDDDGKVVVKSDNVTLPVN